MKYFIAFHFLVVWKRKKEPHPPTCNWPHYSLQKKWWVAAAARHWDSRLRCTIFRVAWACESVVKGGRARQESGPLKKQLGMQLGSAQGRESTELGKHWRMPPEETWEALRSPMPEEQCHAWETVWEKDPATSPSAAKEQHTVEEHREEAATTPQNTVREK